MLLTRTIYCGKRWRKDKSALGTLAMCFVVGLCIAFVWQPLYRAAKQKFHY